VIKTRHGDVGPPLQVTSSSALSAGPINYHNNARNVLSPCCRREDSLQLREMRLAREMGRMGDKEALEGSIQRARQRKKQLTTVLSRRQERDDDAMYG